MFNFLKLVCRNIYNKKLENLNQCFLNKNIKLLDDFSKARYEFLQKELQENSNNDNSFSLRESNFSSNTYEKKTIPKLPNINRKQISDEFGDIEQDLYSRFSTSDIDFLNKFPAKIELTLTG